jgi:hypothetical protein
MAHELRCDNGILFGILDGNRIEVKCRSRRCGAQPGVVVIHHFCTKTGELLDTQQFKDPMYKEVRNGR